MKKKLITVILTLALVLSTSVAVIASSGGLPGTGGGPIQTSAPIPPIECCNDPVEPE